MSNKNKPLSFTLYDLERSIAQKNYNNYEKLIIELLNFMDQRTSLESNFTKDTSGNFICTKQGLIPLHDQMTLKEKEDFYSRLAATITSYLSDQNHTPNDTTLIHFVIFKNYISDIFYLSCYANMDHIMFNRGLANESFELKLKTEQDIKYLYVCLTLNTEMQFDVRQLVTAVPNFGMYWYLGMLYGFHHPFNERIESNFNLLFEAHTIIKDMKLDSTAAELVAAPWMLCSYLDRNDRHDMKVSINHAMQKWVSNNHISPSISKKITEYTAKTKEIKKIVILSEHYKSKHAMYRCYHSEFKLLKDNFDVTLVAAPSNYDDLSSQDFDNVININDTAQDIEAIIKLIVKEKPDLILYPSLGMAKWTIPLANTRLAKYQMMCYGHPASAFSKHIDYSYSSEPKSDWNFQQFCMEQIVPVYQAREFIWEPHPEYTPITPSKPDDGIVRIAINSSLPKITSRFIQMCKLLLEHSTVPIEFNFFLIAHDSAFEKSLVARLNGAIRVHPPTDYMTYMKRLSICDLAIGTFPFGGSNTNTDLALLSIPKIFYSEGCGIASFADQTALDKLKLPEILTPKSEGDLLANLIYLIHNKPLRDQLSKAIIESDPYNLFYTQKPDIKAQTNCKMVDAIRWIESDSRLNVNHALNKKFDKKTDKMIEIDFGDISIK